MNQKNRWLTVGQLARLEKINKRTLHYYDQIGLFSPNVKGENGYRYYTMEQISDLELILAFRELDMSIQEIKEALYGDIYSLDGIVSEKLKEIDHKIEKLSEVRRLLLFRQRLAEIYKQSQKEVVEEVVCEQEATFILSEKIEAESVESYSTVLNLLASQEACYRLFNHEFGIMMDASKIEQGVYDNYDYFYIRPFRKTEGKVFVRPAGTYLRIVYKGDWKLLPDAYRKLHEYAKNHGMELRGYAYERGLNDTLSTNMEECITEIIVRYEKSKGK